MASAAVSTIQSSVAALKESVALWSDLHGETNELRYPAGISLLSLKNHLLLSYLTNLCTLLLLRLSSSESLSNTSGQATVKQLVATRLALEKVQPLEAKLKYQIEKLLKRAADADAGADGEDDAVLHDPLAFKPNPAALMADKAYSSGSSDDEDDEPSASRGDDSKTEVYRPPRFAAVPYNEPAPKSRKAAKEAERAAKSHHLTSLSSALAAGNAPYAETTSGLSVPFTGQQGGSRAQRELKEVEAYEVDNFTRLRGTKKDAKRRRGVEEQVAFGAAGMPGGGRRRLGGFGAEFDDLLHDQGGKGGYERMGAFKKQKVDRDEGAGDSGLGGVKTSRKGGKKTEYEVALKKAEKKARRQKK